MRTFLPVVAVLGLAATAWAQTPKPTGAGPDSQLTERFNRADANRDGSIDDAEARAAGLWFQDDFSGVDTDRSGTVTLFELGQVLQQRVSSWMSEFDAADLNHDGQVTEAEAKKAPNLWTMLTSGGRAQPATVSRSEFESYAFDRIYRQGDLPSVAPNIIEKRF
jgi:hypothetical protein